MRRLTLKQPSGHLIASFEITKNKSGFTLSGDSIKEQEFISEGGAIAAMYGSALVLLSDKLGVEIKEET